MKIWNEYSLTQDTFPDLRHHWEQFYSSEFNQFSEEEKQHRVCQVLLHLVLNIQGADFLLPPIAQYIEAIRSNSILPYFHFSHFEKWLNEHSGCTLEENFKIRGKIAGRWIPRIDYQKIFPLGMGQHYLGNHIVTAHNPPDLDTTIASFWGWIDAFAAQLSQGVHLWNVPIDPIAQTEFELLFYNVFGSKVLSSFAYMWPSLESPLPAGEHQQASCFDHLLSKTTVTLRDFSNRDETKIPLSVEILSCIDHHKSHLSTTIPTVFYLSDAQSVNTMVAECSFQLSDQYSVGGMDQKSIQKQIDHLREKPLTPAHCRLLQRLLQKLQIHQKKQSYFISPKREILEYLHYFYAILDDTDLLSKVSPRDVDCVVSLMNRLQTLIRKEEVEILYFDDLERNETFAKRAAAKILQHPDVYSLYKLIYLAKENHLNQELEKTSKGESFGLFSDTKEQNGCCRVGQVRLFKNNFFQFSQRALSIQKVWLLKAQNFWKKSPHVDFHLQMMSTIPGAEEAFYQQASSYSHLDELWFWIPSTKKAFEHLEYFLSRFKKLPLFQESPIEMVCLDTDAQNLQSLFNESFPKGSLQIASHGLPMMIIRFNPGALNSRKAMITPYLPR